MAWKKEQAKSSFFQARGLLQLSKYSSVMSAKVRSEATATARGDTAALL
eukprot:gene12166-14371_t